MTEPQDAAIHDPAATKQDMRALDARQELRMLALEAKLDLVTHQLITRLGGLMVVLSGLLCVGWWLR